jgi:hypothetical protein
MIVGFRSAKARPFAERKATIGPPMIDAPAGKINRVIRAKKTPRQLQAAEVFGSTGI